MAKQLDLEKAKQTLKWYQKCVCEDFLGRRAKPEPSSPFLKVQGAQLYKADEDPENLGWKHTVTGWDFC